MKYLPGIILILTAAVVLIIAAVSVVYTIMPAGDVKTDITLPSDLVYIKENIEERIAVIEDNTKKASEKISIED
ncbi:MAG: hypothetical protein PHV39_07275 [Methanomicrobium sp.]|nr:hypothetical protein [Methanomicrobium sp.]